MCVDGNNECRFLHSLTRRYVCLVMLSLTCTFIKDSLYGLKDGKMQCVKEIIGALKTFFFVF